jgi:hypothetical protein
VREKGVRKGQAEVFALKTLRYARTRVIRICVTEWAVQMLSRSYTEI